MLGIGYSFTSSLLNSVRDAFLAFTGGAVPDGVTFGRGSVASFWDASGNMIIAPANSPRFDHDPVSLTPRGLLIEATGTNLLLNSTATASNWTVDSSVATDLALNALGYFPGVEVASTGVLWSRLKASVDVTGGIPYALTLIYRAGTSGQARVVFSGLPGGESQFSGVAGSSAVSRTDIGTITSATETLLADGLSYLIHLVFTPTSSGALSIGLGPQSSVSGETVIFLGAQISAGADFTSFIPSVGVAGTRGADTPGLTGFSGTHDVLASYGDGTTEKFPGKVLSEGFWPPLNNAHILSLTLSPI